MELLELWIIRIVAFTYLLILLGVMQLLLFDSKLRATKDLCILVEKEIRKQKINDRYFNSSIRFMGFPLFL